MTLAIHWSHYGFLHSPLIDTGILMAPVPFYGDFSYSVQVYQSELQSYHYGLLTQCLLHCDRNFIFSDSLLLSNRVV